MDSKKISWLAFSCAHIPLIDKSARSFLLQQIDTYKPDVIVNLGDLFEANAATRFPTEYDWTLADEFRVANEFLRDIREAAPTARKVFIEGNHDANIISINRLSRDLRGLCDYRDASHSPELAKHWEMPTRYEYSKRRGVFRLGQQVSFAHGYESSGACDEYQSIILGGYNGLTVLGHTHKPLPVTQARKTADIPLPFWYANAGCLRDLSPHYVSRKRHHRWGHAVVIGECIPVRSPRESPCWDAETIIYKTSEDLYHPSNVVSKAQRFK